MSALLESNPEYQAVKIILVDWDVYRGSDLAESLGIRHQATMVMFKGGKEVGRVAWSSSRKAIEPLFQAALS